jgi:hypothetical protein
MNCRAAAAWWIGRNGGAKRLIVLRAVAATLAGWTMPAAAQDSKK